MNSANAIAGSAASTRAARSERPRCCPVPPARGPPAGVVQTGADGLWGPAGIASLIARRSAAVGR